MCVQDMICVIKLYVKDKCARQTGRGRSADGSAQQKNKNPTHRCGERTVLPKK